MSLDKLSRALARAIDPVEIAAVDAVVRDYIDAWHVGDAPRMERSLHGGLVKRAVSVDDHELRQVTKARMVQLTREGGGDSEDDVAEVVVHHVEGDIASAQVAGSPLGVRSRVGSVVSVSVAVGSPLGVRGGVTQSSGERGVGFCSRGLPAWGWAVG